MNNLYKKRLATRNRILQLEDDSKLGLFGSKKKKEAAAVQDAVNEVRGQYPAPKKCDGIFNAIRGIRVHISDTQAMIDSKESKTVAPRYLEAYNTVLGEYISYAEAYCVVRPADPAGNPAPAPLPPVQAPPAPKPVVPGPVINADPIAQTALPSVTAKPSQLVAATKPAPAKATPAKAVAPVAPPATSKKIPTAALIGGGLVLAVILVLVIVKMRNK